MSGLPIWSKLRHRVFIGAVSRKPRGNGTFSCLWLRLGRQVRGMRNLVFLVAFGFGILFLGCQIAVEPSHLQLSDFKSDGCSLFVDGTFANKELWRGCCTEHDVAYWRGGTAEERKAADIRFRECILKKTGDKVLARTMYEAVRAGGSPHFPTWYRWGYGWPQGRGYKALTDEEEVLVERKLAAYREEEAKERQGTK